MERDKTYSIGRVANMVGVPKYKLRHWCGRYLPEIEKIDIGDMQHRRFADRDIELIWQIKEYRQRGFTLDVPVENARKDFMAGEDKCKSVPVKSRTLKEEVWT